MKRTPDTRQSIFRNPAALGFFARRHRLLAVALGSTWDRLRLRDDAGCLFTPDSQCV